VPHISVTVATQTKRKKKKEGFQDGEESGDNDEGTVTVHEVVTLPRLLLCCHSVAEHCYYPFNPQSRDGQIRSEGHL